MAHQRLATVYSFVFFCTTFTLFILTAFILKDRNDAVIILFLGITLVLYLMSITRMREIMDKVVNLLFPLSLTISKTAWVAHPLKEDIGILSAGKGLYITCIDCLLVYMLFRVPHLNKSTSKNKFILAGFIALSFFSSIYALDIEAVLSVTLLYMKCFILYIWYSSQINDKNIKYLLYGIEISLLLQGLISVCQYISGGPLGLSFLGENNDALRYRTVNETINRSAAGTFQYSSQLAIFSVWSNFLIFFKESNRIRRFAFLGISLMILYFAASRTAMLIFIIAYLVYAWKSKSRTLKKNTALKILFVMIFLLNVTLFTINKGSLDFITKSDIVYQIMRRFEHWTLALNFISEKWILGYGANNYSIRMTMINSSDFLFRNPVHNVFILYWFELGIGGLCIYIIMFITHLMQIRRLKSYDGTKKASLLFIICAIIYNFTGWAFSSPIAIYLLWFSFGVVDRVDSAQFHS